MPRFHALSPCASLQFYSQKKQWLAVGIDAFLSSASHTALHSFGLHLLGAGKLRDFGSWFRHWFCDGGDEGIVYLPTSKIGIDGIGMCVRGCKCAVSKLGLGSCLVSHQNVTVV